MIGQSGVALDVEQVAVGMNVRALDVNEDTDADVRQVRGGIVVRVETDVDQDTGEVTRRFVCAKQWSPKEIRWASLRADEVREVMPFSSADARRLVRAMATVVASRKGLLDTRDHELIDAMAALRQVA